MGFLIANAVTGGSPDYAQMATDQETRREQRIDQGRTAINTAFGGFTPEFYNQREKAYIDFALPQLSQQYQDTAKQVGFGLANRGLTDSSAANSSWSQLSRQMESAKQGIVDTGIGQAQDLKKQVENARDAQLNLLYQSADPESATAGATATAASFSTPSTFAPIANQFSSLIQQYYNAQLINSFRPNAPTAAVGFTPQTSSGAPTESPSLSVGN